MKKKVLILITVLMLLIFSGVSVFASSGRVTYGLDVIAHDMEIAKTGSAGRVISFNAEDFEEALGVSKITSITVLTLPDSECGELRLSGVPVMKNQIISRSSIEKLTFVPADENGFETSFVVGSVSSSQPLAIKCRITVTNPDGSAPEASAPGEWNGPMTVEGVACYSYLTESSADESEIRYRIVSYPENGTLKLLDSTKGYYCYKPVEGFTGRDSFTYVMTDVFGQNPEKVTVEIEVRDCLSDIKYFDMDDSTAHLAAMILAERGIMAGESVCGVSYFNPEGSLRRDEFLAMVMKAAGIDVEYDHKAKTTFRDDDSIAEHLKSYVAYAEEQGYLNGMIEEGNVFDPDESITAAQASLMILNVLGIESTEPPSAGDSADVSKRTDEAIATMASIGLLDAGSYGDFDVTITRAEAAEMLVKVIEMCSK